MKNIIIILLLGIFSLVYFGCDRFEHILEVDQTNVGLDEFGQVLVERINATDQYNYLQLATLFSDNYFNNNMSRDEMIGYFGSFFLIDPDAVFNASEVNISPSLSLSWRFKAISNSKEILTDEVFSDFLISENDGYLLYGNQNNARKVVIELFTGQWCSNCPNAEEALHNLRSKYGSRFKYAEYHIGDQMATDDNFSVLSYYPNIGSVPFAVVNGNAGFIYNALSVESFETEIENMIVPLLTQTPKATFENIDYTLTSSELTGSVQINLTTLETEYLQLVAVLMEDHNFDYTNYNGVPHNNIVLKRSSKDLSNEDLSLPITFQIDDLLDLAAYYQQQLPEDLTLLLWLQTITIPYNELICQIYDVLEIPVQQGE
jgi:thiol-disulfide isomerase/thioredoxin